MARFLGPFSVSGLDENFIPLPDFLTYTEERDHLPTLNENFGWNEDGLWFGPTAEGETEGPSYPVFTSFTIPQNSSVSVSFEMVVDDYCSDVGMAIFNDGTIPNWTWSEPDSTRIAAQFNCPDMELSGLTQMGILDENDLPIPDPGTYIFTFQYDPLAEEDQVAFRYGTSETMLGEVFLSEVLSEGSYRLGFAADSDDIRTYIKNLTITIDGSVAYEDTLTDGNSGETVPPVDIADFVFTNEGDGNSSTMAISNKDMRIETTRADGDIDADISIYAADDVFIEAGGDDVNINANNDIDINAYNGIIILNSSEGQYLGSNASENQIAKLGDIGIETSYPVEGGTAGTQPTFDEGTTPLFTANYIRMSSNLVHFEIQVDMDNISGFGTGQYYMTLPFNAKYGYKFRDGCLHDSDTGRTYHISGHVNASSNVLELYSTDVSGNRLYDFEFSSVEPITLTRADNFHIAGTYIAEDPS
jgi:hypothetical protein